MVIIIDENISYHNYGSRYKWKITYPKKNEDFNRWNEVDFSIMPLNELDNKKNDVGELGYLVGNLVSLGLSLKSNITVLNDFKPRGIIRREFELEKGIGTYFMKRVEDFSILKGCNAIILDAPEHDAREFYKKVGFERVIYREMYKLLRPNPL